MPKKRSHTMEKLARIYDDEILPVWAQPFARMLLRGLEIPENSQILDVACGTGYVTVEILRRMGRGSRVIAIDAASTMLDVARRKVERMGTRDVFFRTENPEPNLSFTDDVYDLLVCNLGLYEMEDPGRAIADFARVVRPGGELRCTIPLRGTFQELYDIYREVLIKHDKHDILSRVDDHLAGYATAERCQEWMRAGRLRDARVDVEEFTMLFKSSREFFFAPVIEFGPLPVWKELSGQGQEMQDIFWYIKEAIDAYFSGRAFEVSVRAACLVGTKLEEGQEPEPAPPEQASPEQASPEQAMFSTNRSAENTQSAELLIESELTDPLAKPPTKGPTGNSQSTGTSEIDIAELEEIDPEEDIDL